MRNLSIAINAFAVILLGGVILYRMGGGEYTNTIRLASCVGSIAVLISDLIWHKATSRT